jgi:hypothetical protein
MVRAPCCTVHGPCSMPSLWSQAVLENVNLLLPKGSRTLVIGPNGAGRRICARTLDRAPRGPRLRHRQIDSASLARGKAHAEVGENPGGLTPPTSASRSRTPHRDGVTIDLSRLHRSHHAVALRLRQVADVDPFRDRSAPTKVSLIVPGWASESAPNPSPCKVAVASLGGGGRRGRGRAGPGADAVG